MNEIVLIIALGIIVALLYAIYEKVRDILDCVRDPLTKIAVRRLMQKIAEEKDS